MKKKNPISRSENMRRIKSKDTSIEILLRKELWKRGFRYRKNVKDIFGKPDIVFKGKKVAIFADSEFWHGKYLMEGKYIPKTNTEFWIEKIERNIERDKAVNQKLKDDGWKVFRFWESDIRKDVSSCADIVEKSLISLF
jgi:DNA mismatch endonuclease (patch repair protein)